MFFFYLYIVSLKTPHTLYSKLRFVSPTVPPLNKCYTNITIITIYITIDSFSLCFNFIYMKPYSIHSCSSFRLLYVAVVHKFFSLHNIPLYKYITILSFILILLDVKFVSSLGLLWVKLFWIFQCMTFGGHICWVLLGLFPRVVFLAKLGIYFALVDTAKPSAWTSLHFHQQHTSSNHFTSLSAFVIIC